MPAKDFSEGRRVYFDHNATTRARDEVIDAMLPFLGDKFGNASSLHFFGQEARIAVELARTRVAGLIGAEQEEIIFTAGGTESDNLAIRGAVLNSRMNGGKAHVVTSSIEHPAVINTCRALEESGTEVTWLPSDSDGMVSVSDLEEAIRDDTTLVSIMLANNETGVIQPVKELAEVARSRGVLFHVDAVQGTGKVPVDVDQLGVDMLTLSAHKFYGPKGIGALYIRRGVLLPPILTGGHQEMGMRPGTENVPAIVGFGEACRISLERLSSEMGHIGNLRDLIEKGILDHVPDVSINGGNAPRVPNTCNVTVTSVEGEALTLNLSMLGFALSSGSACATGSDDPSHVLLAMGIDNVDAQGALRISLGVENTRNDVDLFLSVFPGVVKRLRQMSPLRKDIL
ncbi:MAG: cysteine desulfurase [Candidatus Krumholzibacteria bacterium]|nr:cysteine desulfurase [Candidatus Krumholzibacteria bacterium]